MALFLTQKPTGSLKDGFSVQVATFEMAEISDGYLIGHFLSPNYRRVVTDSHPKE